MRSLLCALLLLLVALTGCEQARRWDAAAPPQPAGTVSPVSPPSAERRAPGGAMRGGTDDTSGGTDGSPTPRRPAPTERVGALFAHDTTGAHYCTASVVDSPAGNLLVTAAHCIHGGRGDDYRDNLLFAPGYRHGRAPYGVWRAKALLVDHRWANRSDPDIDVGFIVLGSKAGRNLADVVGADPLGIDEGYANTVRVTGYPTRTDTPTTCRGATTRKTTATASYLRFACPGYFPGTSGGPWLAHYDPVAGRGEIVGVIGGYHTGGKSAGVSYSSYFDADVLALYNRAIRTASTSR